MFSRNSAQLLSLFPSKTVMPKRDAAVSIMSSNTKQPPPPPEQTSIQHQQAKGHKAAAAVGETSHRRTAAYPALLSDCSQLTYFKKRTFSEAVTALSGANNKAVRQPEPWSQPLHVFWGPISLPFIDYLFLTMQHQGSVSCSAPELALLS